MAAKNRIFLARRYYYNIIQLYETEKKTQHQQMS